LKKSGAKNFIIRETFLRTKKNFHIKQREALLRVKDEALAGFGAEPRELKNFSRKFFRKKDLKKFPENFFAKKEVFP